jgi:hypothetical protein
MSYITYAGVVETVPEVSPRLFGCFGPRGHSAVLPQPGGSAPLSQTEDVLLPALRAAVTAGNGDALESLQMGDEEWRFRTPLARAVALLECILLPRASPLDVVDAALLRRVVALLTGSDGVIDEAQFPSVLFAEPSETRPPVFSSRDSTASDAGSARRVVDAAGGHTHGLAEVVSRLDDDTRRWVATELTRGRRGIVGGREAATWDGHLGGDGAGHSPREAGSAVVEGSGRILPLLSPSPAHSTGGDKEAVPLSSRRSLANVFVGPQARHAASFGPTNLLMSVPSIAKLTVHNGTLVIKGGSGRPRGSPPPSPELYGVRKTASELTLGTHGTHMDLLAEDEEGERKEEGADPLPPRLGLDANLSLWSEGNANDRVPQTSSSPSSGSRASSGLHPPVKLPPSSVAIEESEEDLLPIGGLSSTTYLLSTASITAHFEAEASVHEFPSGEAIVIAPPEAARYRIADSTSGIEGESSRARGFSRMRAAEMEGASLALPANGGVLEDDSMEALLAASHIPPGRRGWVSMGRASPSSILERPTPITTYSDEALVQRLLVVTQWDFDVFEFARRADQRPLAFITFELFSRFNLFEQREGGSVGTGQELPGVPVVGPSLMTPSRLQLSGTVFTAFINRIERSYCYDPRTPNPYHTALHAADVVQAVGSFLVVPRLSQILDPTDALCVLLAAVVHDFRHPGVSNAFLKTTGHPLALRYNDESVLENFHVAESFAVLSQTRYALLSTLPPSVRSAVRYAMIKCVLATDLANGAQYADKFKARMGAAEFGATADDKLVIMQARVLVFVPELPSRTRASDPRLPSPSVDDAQVR